MNERVLIIGLVLALSCVVAFASGRFLLGFLAPLVGTALFMLLKGAASGPGMAVGVFVMMAIPIGALSAVGALIGVAFSPWPKIKKKSEAEPHDR